MKKIELDLNNFKDTYGLSCVENLVLYILKANKMPYQHLYYDSFITIYDIEREFIEHSISYAYFSSISRIQNIAEKEGILKLNLIDSESLILEENAAYCCVMVGPEFFKKTHNLTPWREDHYILLSKINNENFYYINDRPRHIDKISYNDLETCYSGRIIEIELLKNINFLEKNKYIEKLYRNINLNNEEYIITSTNLLQLRDIIGILRIVRKRLFSILSQTFDVDFMLPYLEFLNHSFAMLEYMRIKSENNTQKIKTISKEVSIWDFEINRKIVFLLKKEVH